MAYDTVLPSIVVGARHQVGHSLSTIPTNVTGLRMMTALRTGRVSPLILQRSPKKQAVENLIR
jgi:hypothetical protein